MNRSLLIAITVLMVSCSTNKRGVYFTEMREPPKMSVTGDQLIIETANSIENSALAISKLSAVANDENLELNISAFQTVNRKNMHRFEFSLSHYNIHDIKHWAVYWVDPDGNRTELKRKAKR